MSSYLVTGASRGIGRAVAHRLSTDGHQVYLTSRPGAPVAELPSGTAPAGRVMIDLARPDGFAEALRPLLDELDPTGLDGVVHCAGVVRPGALADAGPTDFAAQFAVNVIAVAELTRLLLPALRLTGGTVLLVNSGSGLNARPPLAAYGASKFALRAYADALRAEEPLLRVCTVYPGRTDTDMQQAVRTAEGGQYQQERYLLPSTVAGVIATVLALPGDGTITDLTLRPASQPGPSSPDAT